MMNALNLLWIIPVSSFAGFIWCALLSANGKEIPPCQSDLQTAFRRLGYFGTLFLNYSGCPRGAVGRACCPIEEEVLAMNSIYDVDGGEWIPVQADALRELVDRYKRAIYDERQIC